MEHLELGCHLGVRQGCSLGWLRHCARHSRRRKCRRLKVETQNINVPACRFYTKHGFTLGAINRYAYTEFPDEIELIWCKEL
ncbi:MAG: GNAT family N-acetyltransferase [Kiritimatiellia bacterium]